MKRIGMAGALITTLAGTALAAGAEWTMVNPTGRTYADEPVRLKLAVPADISPDRYTVREDGRDVPYQVEVVDGKPAVWIAATLSATQTHRYAIAPGRAAKTEPKVQVRQRGQVIEIDNGVVAVRVPGPSEAGLAGPIAQIRLPDGRWVGKSAWHTARRLTRFTADVVGDGTIFGRVRLRYDFEERGGLLDESPAFCEVAITLQPGKAHAIVEESHAMGRDDWWEFDCAAGWTPRDAVVKPHFGGFGRPEMKDSDGNPYAWPPNTLKVGQTRMYDTLLNLHPRWSQAYDDGWMFAAMDPTFAVAAVVCRPGKWLWPHDNAIAVKVRESADYAGLQCPTRRGGRYWFLAAGPRADWQNPGALQAYVLYHAHEGLDKLFQEYILAWPGLKPPPELGLTAAQAAAWASGAGQYATRGNAFVGWGPGGHAGLRNTGHPINTLTRAQALFDPDTFGDYWLFWSPENPNFATSWIHGAFNALAEAVKYPGVKEHPYFKRMQRLAWMKAREEVYHSVTLPSGAGQECFGYMHRHQWRHRQVLCRDVLGVDPDTGAWQEAAARFILRTSHPVARGGRKSHPGGDTHPPGPDVFEGLAHFGIKPDLASLKTEELAGFGVVFHNGPGTTEETYLAFKAGPNRGHFHGDGLSFHYCAYGRPQVIDHHSSYNPRPGGEHMHNRLAFHTDTLPWANMDGYERLIAFKTADPSAVAIGQVESERLRITEPFPPEKWDCSLPEERFETPLKYRRTVVMMKATPRNESGDQAPDTRHATPDYFVFRDQYAGPGLYATYCLHVYGETCERNGATFDFDPVRLTVAKPAAFDVSRHDWSHSNGGLEETKGLRLTVKGDSAEFITVLMPKLIKRVTMQQLLLKDALQRDVRGRGAPEPVWQTLDLVVELVWDAGKLLAAASIRAPELHPAFVCEGAVEGADTDGNLRVSLRAPLRTRGFAGDLDYTVEVRRTGDILSGTYAGALLLNPGKREQRLERSGAVSGKHFANASSSLDVYAAAALPEVSAIPGGVRVGDDEIVFAGGLDGDEATHYVAVKRGGKPVLELTGKDIDMNRSQGDIGLFVPDAGYPFGDIPGWLLRQRVRKPDWYEDVWPPAAFQE